MMDDSEMMIWHHGQPLTLRVWDYGDETDVEIHRGHRPMKTDAWGDYVEPTVTLTRSTHIIADMWEHMDAAVKASA